MCCYDEHSYNKHAEKEIEESLHIDDPSSDEGLTFHF